MKGLKNYVLIKRFIAGQPLLADDINNVIDAVMRSVVGGVGITVRQYQNQIIIENASATPTTTAAQQIQAFQVKAAGWQNDYLQCTAYDQVNAAAQGDVNVAKPWELRRTPFDTETITYANAQSITYTYSSQRERSATDGTYTETQLVTPDYAEDEIILAIRGNTGVTDALGWTDLNVAGRQWAKEYP
ncbi:MAG: hypothetical protein GY832_22025 [Chloroflexi bacterium]|nr:hypothetical protein [Chloroflexota bacterium]